MTVMLSNWYTPLDKRKHGLSLGELTLFGVLGAATFGLLFGLLCAPVYIFTGGLGFAISWWISGIPFDLLHCGGNFVMALVLFVPLRKLLEKLYARMRATNR